MAEGRDNGQVYLGLNLDTSELLAVNQVLDFCVLFIRFALCESRRSGSHPSLTSMPQLGAPSKQDYRVQVYSPPQLSRAVGVQKVPSSPDFVYGSVVLCG